MERAECGGFGMSGVRSGEEGGRWWGGGELGRRGVEGWEREG